MPGDKYLQSVLHLISLGTNGQVLAIDEDSDAGVKFVDASEGITELTSTQLGAGSGTEGSILMDNGDGTASWGELTPDQLGSDSGTAGNVLVDNGDGSAAWAPIPAGAGVCVGGLFRDTIQQAIATVDGGTGHYTTLAGWNAAHIPVKSDYVTHSIVTNNDKITIVTPGIYNFSGQLLASMDFSAWNNLRIEFLVDGVPIFEVKQGGYTTTMATDSVALNFTYDLDAGQYVQIKVWCPIVGQYIYSKADVVPASMIGSGIKTWLNIAYLGT